MTIDKVTLEILKNHTRAAAESMAYTLYRTAHSTFVKETEDFTTGLTTADGETFATPTELGATWFVGLNYGRAIKMIDDYNPGDICITNDPYSGFVCTHPPDMHIWKPIFYQSEVVAFSVGHIHNTDVGGGGSSVTIKIIVGSSPRRHKDTADKNPHKGGDKSASARYFSEKCPGARTELGRP